MSRTQDNDPNVERLEEFGFLFKDLHSAVTAHPAKQILEEYVRGIRPKGIDLQGWQSSAVSVHIGLCPECQLRVAMLRRKQRVRQYWQRAFRWRPAYQYMGVLVFIVGLVAFFWLMRGPPNIAPPTPHQTPIEHSESSTGLARLR